MNRDATVGRVPVVVAVRPGQDAGEGGEEVVEGPRQNDVVINITPED